jgi:SAM-dependent methyltransferase
MSPEIHAAAAVGFERSADAYERGRPDFPPEAVQHLIERLGLGPSRTVADLGAGTGKMARLLMTSGARVLAVEPVAAMRTVLRGRAPGVEQVAATAEALPFSRGSLDAAVAAQAFHWFDARRALASLAEVIAEDGGLGMVWNVRDEHEPWVRAITEIIEPYRGDTPSHRSMRWMDAFEPPGAWSMPERTSFDYAHASTTEAVLDRVLSISFIAALPTTERRRVAARVASVLPAGADLAFPYRTDVWISRRGSQASATIA